MIRVSTYSAYQNGVSAIAARQRELLAAQSQVASAKRINTPSDDPIGAGTAAMLRSESAQFTQFANNQQHAVSMLNNTEGALTNFIGAVQDTQDRLGQSNNGTLTDTDRKTLADDLQGILGRMIGVANSSDGTGGFLFAGSKDSTTPFATSGNNVTFQGNSQLQSLEVSQNRFQTIKYSGDALFMKLRPGNGTFTTAATQSNTGSGSMDSGTVVNASLVTGNYYTISFSVAGGVTTYNVQNTTTAASAATGTLASPGTITFDGQQVGVTGAPANGDTFTVAPAGYQSIFQSMADAITALNAPGQSPSGRALYGTAVQSLNATMQGALIHLTAQRADVGTKLSELDAYQQVNDGRSLEFQTRISGLEDLDMVAGATKVTQGQITFQAALQSYSSVSKLSLFNYM